MTASEHSRSAGQAGLPQALEQALDVVVFGPIGAIRTALDDPQAMARKGRWLVSRELRSARALGRFAVDRAARQLGALADQLPSLVGSQLEAWRRLSGASQGSGAQGPGKPPAGQGHASDGAGRRPRARRRPGPATPSLAIPGYDSLSASQVLPRLAGLSSEELEEVRRYEAANRGRRTILNRIAQLQAGTG